MKINQKNNMMNIAAFATFFFALTCVFYFLLSVLARTAYYAITVNLVYKVYEDVTMQLNTHQSIVSRIIKRYQDTNNFVEDKGPR